MTEGGVALVVFAHGSSVAEANAAVLRVSDALARAGGFPLVIASFLEQAHPDLAEAVAEAVRRGAKRIVVVPYFLTLGIHLRRDLPRIVRELQGIHSGVSIEVTEPLDGHPALLQALLDRAREGLYGTGNANGTAD